jgi:CheY-like chemotaxis protein
MCPEENIYIKYFRMMVNFSVLLLGSMEGKNKLRILVVDDEPLLVKLNKRQLENVGYVVDSTTESTDALRMISDSPEEYDLMITDLTMPNLTGRQLISKVLRIAPKLPIIVFTGMKDEGVEEDLHRMGVRLVVEKPVVENELVDAVNRVLANG